MVRSSTSSSPGLDEVVIAQTPRRLPVVLTPTEVRELLQQLSGIQGLVAAGAGGPGLRFVDGL
jgi:hypothetical protein